MLGGLMGNFTISWSGLSQTADHLKRGRLLTAYRQWRLFYRNSSDSRWTAFRKLFIDPLAPDVMARWANRWRHRGVPPWAEHAAIRPQFATEMRVDARARAVGHDFLYRKPAGERAAGLALVDFLGDWLAAEKAIHGVETRDPTADIDVIEYSFGVPPEQYLAEGIARSLVRRAMWGILPDVVLTNRLTGLQSADWYEKLTSRRERLTAEIGELSTSSLARRAIDIARLEQAVKTWPTAGWGKKRVIDEYQLALTRGVAAGRFLRWIEAANRSD
jgi:asparagine synthase (glutamine-hydrolysing)